MINKSFKVIGALWLIQIILIACCDSERLFSRIISLQVDNYNIETEQNAVGTIAQDNFRIRLTISEETYANNSLNPYFMLNSAYAAIDCFDINAGLESDIVGFSMTCDKDILDTIAGEPIDFEKLNVYRIRFFDDADNNRRTIEEWIDIMNNGGHLLAFEWFFEFNETIDSSEALKFKIKIIQEDNTEFEVETNPILIE